MCRVFDIKPSSYYDWVGHDLSDQRIHRNQCELLVRAGQVKPNSDTVSSGYTLTLANKGMISANTWSDVSSKHTAFTANVIRSLR